MFIKKYPYNLNTFIEKKTYREQNMIVTKN